MNIHKPVTVYATDLQVPSQWIYMTRDQPSLIIHICPSQERYFHKLKSGDVDLQTTVCNFEDSSHRGCPDKTDGLWDLAERHLESGKDLPRSSSCSVVQEGIEYTRGDVVEFRLVVASESAENVAGRCCVQIALLSFDVLFPGGIEGDDPGLNVHLVSVGEGVEHDIGNGIILRSRVDHGSGKVEYHDIRSSNNLQNRTLYQQAIYYICMLNKAGQWLLGNACSCSISLRFGPCVIFMYKSMIILYCKTEWIYINIQ